MVKRMLVSMSDARFVQYMLYGAVGGNGAGSY